MASSLRKYKYNGPTAPRPKASTTHEATNNQSSAPSPAAANSSTANPSTLHEDMDVADLKSQILQSIRGDISVVIKEELRNALAEDFNHIKTELQAVRNELANNTAMTCREIDQVKATVKEVESGLSLWSDEVTTLQDTVTNLQKDVTELKSKCEDMEGRMRRCNVRILGIPEDPNSSSTTSVSKLLKDVLGMDREIVVDRSHRSLGPRKQDGKPRAIVAKLHYYQDCVEILRQARTKAPLRFNGKPVAIFPDYTTAVARARAAFTDVRKLLHDRRGVRFGILFPARLRITHDGEDKEFLDPSKAMEYVKKHIVKTAEGEI